MRENMVLVDKQKYAKLCLWLLPDDNEDILRMHLHHSCDIAVVAETMIRRSCDGQNTSMSDFNNAMSDAFLNNIRPYLKKEYQTVLENDSSKMANYFWIKITDFNEIEKVLSHRTFMPVFRVVLQVDIHIKQDILNMLKLKGVV